VRYALGMLWSFSCALVKSSLIAWFQNVRKTSACYSSLGALWANQPNHWLTNAPKSYSRSWLKPTNHWLFRHCWNLVGAGQTEG
jgi:hypothetical protein